MGKAKVGKADATKVEVKGQPVGNVTPGDLPTLESLGFKPAKPGAKQPFTAISESYALTQLRTFCDFAKKQDAKKALPFGVLSAEFSRLMSSSMALGCVSPSRVLQEASKLAPRLVQSGKKGNGWLKEYLLHRDYTQLTALKSALKERKQAAAQSSNGQVAYAYTIPG